MLDFLRGGSLDSKLEWHGRIIWVAYSLVRIKFFSRLGGGDRSHVRLALTLGSLGAAW